jgi:hypothetical protein
MGSDPKRSTEIWSPITGFPVTSKTQPPSGFGRGKKQKEPPP